MADFEAKCKTCKHPKGSHNLGDGEGCGGVISYEEATNSYERCHCNPFVPESIFDDINFDDIEPPSMAATEFDKWDHENPPIEMPDPIKILSVTGVGVSGESILLECEVKPDVFQMIEINRERFKSIYEYIAEGERNG